MTVAVRPLDATLWAYQKPPSQIIWDSHNYVNIALDSAGNLHVSGNMHCVPLVYFRTEKPNDITSLSPAPMTGLLDHALEAIFPEMPFALVLPVVPQGVALQKALHELR